MRTRGRWITYCPRAGLQVCPGAVCCPTGASGNKICEKNSPKNFFSKKISRNVFKKKFLKKIFPQKNFLKIFRKYFFLKFLLNKNFPQKNKKKNLSLKKFSPKF